MYRVISPNLTVSHQGQPLNKMQNQVLHQNQQVRTCDVLPLLKEKRVSKEAYFCFSIYNSNLFFLNPYHLYFSPMCLIIICLITYYFFIAFFMSDLPAFYDILQCFFSTFFTTIKLSTLFYFDSHFHYYFMFYVLYLYAESTRFVFIW